MTRTNTILLTLLTGMFFLGLSGCDPEFKQDGPRFMPHMISSPSSWSITSRNGTFLNLNGAIDSMNMTAATTVGDYRNASVILDLSRPCMFNMVAVLHSVNEFGYASMVSLDTSNDGKKWTHRLTIPGTRKVTYFPLLTPVTARYVRITAIRPGRLGWHISEIYFQ